jgi:hypothetical protein
LFRLLRDSPLPKIAFLYYKTTYESGQDNQNIVLRVEISKVTTWRAGLECLLAFHSNGSTLDDLSMDDLNRLKWSRRLRINTLQVTAQAQSRLKMVLGVPTGSITLTCTSSHENILPAPPLLSSRPALFDDIHYFIRLKVLMTSVLLNLLLFCCFILGGVSLGLVLALVRSLLSFHKIAVGLFVITVAIFLFSAPTVSQFLWRIWVGGLVIALTMPDATAL